MGFSFENLRFEVSKCTQNRRFWAKCARRSIFAAQQLAEADMLIDSLFGAHSAFL